MAQNNSAEEIEQQHLKALGPDLGPVFHGLYNEVVWLHAKWLEYRKLFAQSEQRVDLLNQTAAFFFRVIQDVLWDDILLFIARLTDPSKQGKSENLTLLRLPDVVPDPALADELRQDLQAALKTSNFAREWRNKRLAHRDLALVVDRPATSLPAVSRAHVEEALAFFRLIMNRVHAEYLDGEVAFEHFLTYDDADELVQHLGIAVRSIERQRDRFQHGNPLPEDLEPPPAV